MARWERFVLVALAMLMLFGGVSAQEVDFDYRAYKFYKEEPLLVSLEDTARVFLPKAGYVANVAQRSESALYRLNYRNMGERGSEGYALAHHSLDYTTARLLSQLRVYGEVDRGGVVSALYSTTSFDPNQREYRGRSLRAELSGRGYTGGVSYSLGYKPDYMGVMLDEGWSYRLAARLAGGDDLYVDGVSANIFDISFGARWEDRRSRLNIFAMLPCSKRGLSRASVEECYSLLGDRHYNPLWGIDHGELRNSRVATLIRPEVLLSWDYDITVSTTMHLTADLYYAAEGVTSLGWFNASTPLPDNYHYLPSYYDSSSDAKYVTDAWLSDNWRYTQVDWAGMRHTNALQLDGHARYVVESRREDVARGDVTLAFDTKLRGADVSYGLRLGGARYHRYKVLDDLLGATHILDLDYYMADDATYKGGTKNNLRDSNLVVGEGDTFCYDYALRWLRSEIFGRVEWEYEDFSLAASADIGSEHISRKGRFEKELFRGAGSYGRSQSVALHPYRFAFAASYMVDNQTFGASLLIAAESHEMDDLFFNPEYNNRVVADVEMAKRRVAKLSYAVVPSSALQFSALLYANHYKDGVEVVRYYDDLAGVYSNGVVKGVSWFGYGLDLGAEVDWNRLFASNFRMLLSSYRYSDNAHMNLYSNRDNSLVASSDVMIKGCHMGSAEMVLYGDVSFRYSGWRATASLSWCDGGYLAPSFVPRSERVLAFAVSNEERAALMAQRNLSSATSMDLSVSKRVKLNEESSLSATLAIRNLLGGGWIESGYESNRVRCVANDYYSRILKSAEMVNYSYPRMLYLSLSVWF